MVENRSKLIALIVVGVAAVGLVAFLMYGAVQGTKAADTQQDVSAYQSTVAELQQTSEQLKSERQQTLRGVSGPRGPRGYKGDKGARGFCVAMNLTSGAETEFKCPDAADSASVQVLKNTVTTLSRLLIQTQSAMEQRVRSEGGSGLVQVRAYRGGSRPYHEPSYASYGSASAHDHANNLRTVGIGEIGVVLNGVEFWTRHNDYSLKMPHRQFSDYGLTEDVPLNPNGIPPAVSNAGNVAAQVAEMQLWFKAFKDQDYSVRDYRPYFKPVLCVLEGNWITDTGALNEPFASDRHHIDAATWEALHSKMHFLLNSGRKNNLENLAFLPSAIREMAGENKTEPVFSNFDYRIICHPLKDDLPTNRFKVVQDLHSMLFSGSALDGDQLAGTRRARFELNQRDQDSWHDGPNGAGLLDKLMYEVPGRSNYPANFTDKAFGLMSLHYENPVPLNTGYYSRFYQTADNDAMGRSRRRRGFNDGFLFAAQTDHEKVSGKTVDDGMGPKLDPNCMGNNCKRHPNPVNQKWSWAIPLEIVYTTPLTAWNPHAVNYYGEDSSNPLYQGVTANGRNGHPTDPNLAYNGIHRRVFYQTPAEFFAAPVGGGDPADTSGDVVGVLDTNGNVKQMRASGHWILFPEIGGGVGVVRQRYPIYPIHEEGNTVWKELQAFKDLLSSTGGSLGGVRSSTFGETFELTMALGHTHYLQVSGAEISQLKAGTNIVVRSSLANAHQHDVTLTWDATAKEVKIVSMTNPEGHGLATVVL